LHFGLQISEEALANIKSAIKRNKQNEKRRVKNRIFRGRARTFVQKARTDIAAGSREEALRPCRWRSACSTVRLTKA
jgi:ribosomal protein S20